jgi:hypothetical protein
LGRPHSRSGIRKKAVTFYLDECLPHQIAGVLNQVGHPITSWYEEFKGQQGLKDPYLIPYLGGQAYTWITKDDSAKREHEPEIRAAQISVVWVCGLERPTNKPKQNFITVKDLHRMLTDKLDALKQMITDSNKPQYFTLGMRTNGIPHLTKTTLEEFFKGCVT